MLDADKTKAQLIDELVVLRQRVAELEKLESHPQNSQTTLPENSSPRANKMPLTEDVVSIQVANCIFKWYLSEGICTAWDFPVLLMWVDSTLASLMAGVQAMVGTERFSLALQSEGRKSIDGDWQVISSYPNFEEGFAAWTILAKAAGWGDWHLISIDRQKQECCFRVRNSWEGSYQKALGVCWGSSMLAGKLAGCCSRLFQTNCWSEQTAFIARGDEADEFIVRPSDRSVEEEIEKLLLTDHATRADMAVALQKLQREIAERQQVEVALRESEERLRLALDSAQMGYWDWNILTDKVTWSENHERFFGIAPGRFGGTYEAFLELVHPEDRQTANQAVIKALSEKTDYKDEFRIIRNDGSIRWIAAKGKFFYNEAGQAVRMIGVSIDMSDRKHTEDALRHQSQITQTITDNATSCLFMMNAQGLCTFMNPAGEKMTGYTFAELEGQILHNMVHHTHPDGTPYPLSECPIDRALPQNNQMRAHEDVFVRKDGTFFPVVCAASPIIEDGVPIATVIEVRDITEEKRAEAERTQLLAREQAARKEAEEANRIKDEFLAVLSHELRTPLNPILGWINLLRTRKFNEAKVNQALEVIERNAKLQAQLVEDLLDVSRILQGKLSLHAHPVDLAVVIESAIETVQITAEAKSIEIKWLIPLTGFRVWGDASRLQQVVWNLLSNAVKFTPAQGKVEISLEYFDTYAQIQVTDTGKGISPDFLPYVFDYFRQADSTTTRAFGGLGLGLAIVRKLVELHGGSVQADSKGFGQGATFTVTLPLMRSVKPVFEDDSTSIPTTGLEGLQILAVDDDPDSLELITFLLEQYGAVVKAVSSANEALATLQHSPPDILISDVGMPEMDGYMLIRQVRSLSPEQGGLIPAIALTAYAGETNQKQLLKAGFQRHVTKPVEPDELTEAISSLVRKS